MIFLTEGQSAAGFAGESCRDVMTQAIFVLKGKPLNVNDLKRAALYKNDELYNLMRSLNIEESIDGLRYEKVILATDADVDGLHIRNLLITFFLRFFPDLVVCAGMSTSSKRPLFRVRNKKKTVYCYDEAERVAALKAIANPEITRFKGLGEINPSEFKAIRRWRDAPESGGGRKPPRHPAHPGFLHGQEHARTSNATSWTGWWWSWKTPWRKWGCARLSDPAWVSRLLYQRQKTRQPGVASTTEYPAMSAPPTTETPAEQAKQRLGARPAGSSHRRGRRGTD